MEKKTEEEMKYEIELREEETRQSKNIRNGLIGFGVALAVGAIVKAVVCRSAVIKAGQMDLVATAINAGYKPWIK
jgi:hypothetical protein